MSFIQFMVVFWAKVTTKDTHKTNKAHDLGILVIYEYLSREIIWFSLSCLLETSSGSMLITHLKLTQRSLYIRYLLKPKASLKLWINSNTIKMSPKATASNLHPGILSKSGNACNQNNLVIQLNLYILKPVYCFMVNSDPIFIQNYRSSHCAIWHLV